MAAVDRRLFDASIVDDKTTPAGGRASLMVLPLSLIAHIVSYLDDPGDLARLCRTSRVLNYMTLPQLYRTVVLTSYDKIRYRNDEPEGYGGASLFSMGLDTLITRPFASLVRSLTLRGEWRELELKECAKLGKVPDSSMMLNIAVRAAVDRTRDLESFSWELNTKMLQTVYLGLSQLPKLTSLTIKFPSSRDPRPIVVIPPIPHLRCLKVTDIDPLCYPDDISTLLLKSRKLQELKMHWSPRMRNAQEPSVTLSDYFRKCVAAEKPLRIKKFSVQNLYAVHRDDIDRAIDENTLEEFSFLNDPGSSGSNMHTFVDRTWPVNPQSSVIRLKCLRHDVICQRLCDFLGKVTGLERLYFVNSARDPNSPANFTLQSSSLLSAASSPTGYFASSNFAREATSSGSSSPDASTSVHNPQISLRDNYLNTVFTHHSATLRHLLLSSRWIIPSTLIARLVHSCPQLEQLGFATDFNTMDTLPHLLPVLRDLVAFRLLIPSGSNTPSHQSMSSGIPHQKASSYGPSAANWPRKPASVQCLTDIMELDDAFLAEEISLKIAEGNVPSKLQIIGIGWKAWKLIETYTAPPVSMGYHANFRGGPQPGRSHYPNNSMATTKTMQPESRNSHTLNVNGYYSNENGSNAPSSSTAARPMDVANPPLHPIRAEGPIQAPSPLGKRTRNSETTIASPTSDNLPLKTCSNSHEKESAGNDDSTRPRKSHKTTKTSDFNTANAPMQTQMSTSMSTVLYNHNSNCMVKRRFKLVGWEVLRNWEIWSLDSQEL